MTSVGEQAHERFDVASRKKLTAFERLRRCALSYPEAHEDHPWGETAIKVRGKVFVFLGADGVTVKLPRSFEFALEYPGTNPAAYGLGKSRWISSGFGARNTPPLDVLEHWIAESYSAVAPKKLSSSCPAHESRTIMGPTKDSPLTRRARARVQVPPTSRAFGAIHFPRKRGQKTHGRAALSHKGRGD